MRRKLLSWHWLLCYLCRLETADPACGKQRHAARYLQCAPKA